MQMLDRWCKNAWIITICVIGFAAIVWLICGWNVLPLGAKGCLFASIIMPLHVIEEWKWPAGLHYFYNTVFFAKLQSEPKQLCSPVPARGHLPHLGAPRNHGC